MQLSQTRNKLPPNLKNPINQGNKTPQKKTQEQSSSLDLLESSSLNNQKKMPLTDPQLNNVQPSDKPMVIRRSYAMVISSYENVARRGKLTGAAAEQIGETISRRIEELNSSARNLIRDIPEYQKLDLEKIEDLGDKVEDMINDNEQYLKIFALLKNPQFAEMMESTEGVHRSFAEMMQDHGSEQLMFGAIEMVNELGGLEQVSAQATAKPTPSVNIKV
ncbi:MAG: hypothetical protein HQM12_12835 [SAR324 cluster bacterium]|nr:hypothetical protein [SAR324 cluster bacterium]MBF0353295.1 hypothetical protein [SAR324 cluster bacterium]